MRKIAVCGAGYVGLTAAACLASLGNQVACYDTDESRVAGLQSGIIPFFEPGLGELVHAQAAAGRLSFFPHAAAATAACDVILVAVGTRPGAGGTLDLSALKAAAEGLRALAVQAVIVNKSTVPPDSPDLFSFASDTAVNPEFLREGHAVHDFLHPDRIIIGTESARAREIVAEMYAPLDAPMIATDPRTAMMIKYASNAFLASKVSFANEIAALCHGYGIDADTVLRGVGTDRRAGAGYLTPGLGFGGSCLPKDLAELREFARRTGNGSPLLDAVERVNDARVPRAVEQLRSLLRGLSGKRIAILGYAFKGGTGDVRASRALALVRALLTENADVATYDPAAEHDIDGALRCDDVASATHGAHAAVVAADWDEFRTFAWSSIRDGMREPLIVDARNCVDRKMVENAGMRYAPLL